MKLSKPQAPEVQVGNTGVGVASLSKDHKMVIDEIVWNDVFGDSSNENLKVLMT